MFFKPRWSSKDPVKAAKAIAALTDQVEIGKAAQMALDSENRILAIRKLTLQDILWKIICDDRDYKIRYAAVKSLRDKTLLRKLAESNHPEWRLRAAAWQGLGEADQVRYLHVLYGEKQKYGKDSEHAHRLAAMNDTERAYRLAVMEDLEHTRRLSVMDDMRSQELLYSLAMEASLSDELREHAVTRLHDPILLQTLYSSGAMRRIVIKTSWELVLIYGDETLMPFVLENSPRSTLIYYLYEIVKDNTLHEWLLHCTCATVERMMTPERLTKDAAGTITYEEGERLIQVLRALHEANPELRPCIEKYDGAELVKEGAYHCVECHNSDDSCGTRTEETLYFRLGCE